MEFYLFSFVFKSLCVYECVSRMIIGFCVVLEKDRRFLVKDVFENIIFIFSF